MISRRHFFSAGLAATGGVCLAQSGVAQSEKVSAVDWSFDGEHGVRLWSPLIKAPIRLRFIADTHFGLADERDQNYADFYKRMAQWGAQKETFEATLPRPGACDLLVLGGDNISFPTLANVEYLSSRLEACGVPYAYVAGNHDWHLEGDKGSDFEQRARWIEARLKPLYGGRNPLMSVVKVKGVKVILIDNSVYHVTPEQLAFWKRETKGPEPVLLFMHIPLWEPGWDTFTCGCPDWGAKNDTIWQIERRERWAERQMPSTFAFREAVFSTPTLLGVFTGHEHRLMAATTKGFPQLVVPANRSGAYFDITAS